MFYLSWLILRIRFCMTTLKIAKKLQELVGSGKKVFSEIDFKRVEVECIRQLKTTLLVNEHPTGVFDKELKLSFGLGKDVAVPARHIVLGNVFYSKDVVIGQFGHSKVIKLFFSLLLEDLVFLFGLYVIYINILLLALIFGFALGGDVGLAGVVGEGFEDLLVLFLLLFGGGFVVADVLAVGHLQAAQDAGLAHLLF